MTLRRALLAATVAASTVTALVCGPPAARAGDATPADSTAGLTIGSWDVDLTPLLGGQDAIVDKVAGSDFDVLALQGVWSAAGEAALLADPRIQAEYPYHYVAPAAQAVGSIPFTPGVAGPTSGGVQPQVTELALRDYVGCLISTGVDTRTVITPATPIPLTCQFLGLNIRLASGTGFSTLAATLQTVPEGEPGAYQAIDEGFAGTGVLYGYDGRPGQLILSAYPIEDPQDRTFTTDLVRRDNIVATIAGLRIVFGNWPTNYLADADPTFGAYQVGALQPDLADDALSDRPDLVVGSLNTGPDYQSDAFDQLVAAGYRPTSHAETYCPAGADGFSRCEAQSPRATDNVLVGPTARCTSPGTFATDQLSEHIGVSARCAPAPAVTVLSPAAGPTAGGQVVVITGTGLSGATKVVFGRTPAASYAVDSDTQITAVSPEHGPGVVRVRVQTIGLSAKNPAARYRFG